MASMSCKIKICGVTNREDALMVSESGADYLGVLVEVPGSPRSLSREIAGEVIAAARIPVLLLTFDLLPDRLIKLARELRPYGVQLAGNEAEQEVKVLKDRLTGEVWKSLHIPVGEGMNSIINETVDKIVTFTEAGADRIVLDTAVVKGTKVEKGGTGQTFDWSIAREIKSKVNACIFLAGGLKPDNIKNALRQVNPDGIDLSSGVEKSPGRKDEALVKSVIAAVRKGKNLL